MTSFDKLREDVIRLIRKEDYKSASESVECLIHDYPLEPEAWNTRAYLNANCGNHQGAVADMSTAILIEAFEPGYFFTRGRYLFKLGRFLEAIKDFTATIDLSVKASSEYYLSAALFFRADAYVRLGLHEAARTDCARIPISFQLWTDQLRNRADILAACSKTE